MSGKPDASNIGQERGVQDPADAMEGTYTDAVDKMPVEEKLPMKQMPQGPDPSPYTITGGGGG